MLPPEEYERAAKKADYHLQLAIQIVNFAPDEATLTGTVVRVFRGPPELDRRRMQLKVNYFNPEEDQDWAPDGLHRFPAPALRAGRILEAFIVQTPDGLEITADLCTLIDAATDRPQME
jgi:hypothetical protein